MALKRPTTPYVLRITNQITKDHPDTKLSIFLMAADVNCAISSQITPNGYYNLERMLKLSTSKGAKLLTCGSCLEARGLKSTTLLEKAEISTMAKLTQLIIQNHRILTF
jgi:uncharacterized protein involved in oxidation of intracellular sulfur